VLCPGWPWPVEVVSWPSWPSRPRWPGRAPGRGGSAVELAEQLSRAVLAVAEVARVEVALAGG